MDRPDSVTVNATAGDDHIHVATSLRVGRCQRVVSPGTIAGAEGANDSLVGTVSTATSTIDFVHRSTPVQFI